ncbi:MAG: DUF559 domain-containing protein [Chloroflexota bacterium]
MTKTKIEKNVLVAILPKIEALDRLQNEGWYHIPVETAPKDMPPKILAFYQGKVFGKQQAYQIRYFGEVSHCDVLPRKVLFPNDEQKPEKAEKLYYRLEIAALEERIKSIPSYRPRRLVFIPTTLEKFERAEQINDLFNSSPLEDKLWSELKDSDLLAERQWRLSIKKKIYFLDFALFCKDGDLAIETDGYTTHYDSIRKIDEDIWRQNEILNDRWHLLRYTSNHIKEGPAEYMVQIQEKIDQLGGLKSTAEVIDRKIGENAADYQAKDYDDYFRDLD